jgi:hypothetical protein
MRPKPIFTEKIDRLPRWLPGRSRLERSAYRREVILREAYVRINPEQAQLILQAGFQVPETLVTNDPELVRAFHFEHGQVIYKSISGVPSIVRMLDDELMDRLPLVHGCPVQRRRASIPPREAAKGSLCR